MTFIRAAIWRLLTWGQAEAGPPVAIEGCFVS